MNKNKKIYFIRHSKVDLPYENHSKMPYNVLKDLASGKLDPSIDGASTEIFLEATKNIPLEKIDVIYFNNSGNQSVRSKDSALLAKKIIEEKFKKTVDLIGEPDLRELTFDLDKILPEEVFIKEGIKSLRSAVYEAVVNGGPIEQVKDLFARIDNIKNVFSKHEKDDLNILVVSHDFFMRSIEIYLRKTNNYQEVSITDFESTDLNGYFEGFATSYSFDVFERLG